MDLLLELQKAIDNNDSEKISKIRDMILNSNKNIDIDINFIQSIKNKVIYKNMKKLLDDDNSLSTLDKAKMVTSLITHCIIDIEINNTNKKDYPIVDLYVILGYYINDDIDKFNHEVINFINDRYGNYLRGDNV